MSDSVPIEDQSAPRLLCPDHEEESFAPACFVCDLIRAFYVLRQRSHALQKTEAEIERLRKLVEHYRTDTELSCETLFCVGGKGQRWFSAAGQRSAQRRHGTV